MSSTLARQFWLPGPNIALKVGKAKMRESPLAIRQLLIKMLANSVLRQVPKYLSIQLTVLMAVMCVLV